MAAGILQGTSSGVQYEQRRLTDAVGDKDPADVLTNTRAWLQTGFQKASAWFTPSVAYCLNLPK